eukprot:s574_g5.t1
MFASVCNLFGRSLFVTVAAPLVLLGSLLNQVSIELEVQSVQNLRYAVEESSIAAGSEEEAARDVGEAALDQTEAELLEDEAESLNADVAEGTAGTAAQAEAGEAEAELEAVEEERASELSEQVESLASEVAENLPKLPAAAEAAAASGGLDAAGEAAVDAVAATATGVAAPTVGADAVLAGVAGTVAVEGPKVVAAAKEEWALGSTELQAANDERLAIEKEVQAGALEGDVPVLQASALGAEEAAYGSFMTAAAYLTAATGAQLLALVMQVPVLAVFASQWLLDLRANVRGKLESIPTQDDGHLWAVELFSQTALYGAIGASMLVPWSNVVVMAAKFEEMGDEAVHQLSALPSLIEKAVPILSRGKEAPKEFSSESPKSRRLRQQSEFRRLWDWQKDVAWMSKTEAVGRHIFRKPKLHPSLSSRFTALRCHVRAATPHGTSVTDMGGGSKMGTAKAAANLRAIEIVDLSRFGPGDFETSDESAVPYHLLLSARSRRGIGLACEWTQLGITQLAIAVEDSVCVFQTPPSARLPAIARDLLTQVQLPKIYAGDLAPLQEKVQKSFDLQICGVIDIRRRESVGAQSADVVANRAFLSLLALQDPKPRPKAAQAPKKVSFEPKMKAEWREQGILLGSDGFYCWLCNAGPSPEGNMQQHVDSAQHKRRVVLAGIKQDSTILPPVPKEYADRGIIISPTKDGTLQYTCKLCKAGQFPTLERHLAVSASGRMRYVKPDDFFGCVGRQRMAGIIPSAKEGFILVEGQLHCERCSAGPFDRQGLRQHRLSLQHREAEVNSERLGLGAMVTCSVTGWTSSFASCPAIADSLAVPSAATCVMYLRPLWMACCSIFLERAIERPVLPLMSLSLSSFAKSWWLERPGAAILCTAACATQQPWSRALANPRPRAMVAKADVEVCDEGFLGAKMGDKVTVLEESPGEDKVWAEKDGKEGWILKTQLVKKLAPWQLQKAGDVKKEPAAPKVVAAPVVMRHMITTSDVQHPSPHALTVSEGQKVELLAFLQSGWACVRDDQGHCGLLPSSALAESWRWSLA